MNFQRDYRLRINVIINDVSTDIVIEPPIRIDFNCIRSTGYVGNSFRCSIYNLNETKRLLLVKDAEEIKGQIKPGYINLIFEAGYEGNMNTIFKGQIHTAGSRRAKTDIITELNCITAGVDTRTSFTSATVTSDNPVERIVDDMPNTTLGKVSKSIPKLLRPRVVVGNSLNQLQKMYPDHSVAIDNGVLNIVADDEVIASYIPLISPQTGLKGTPYRESQRVVMNSIILPQVTPLGRVRLESMVHPHLDGQYRVEIIEYNGDNWSTEWDMKITGYERGTYSLLEDDAA